MPFFAKIACPVDWSVVPILLDTELQKLAPKSESGRLHADSLIQLTLLDGVSLMAVVRIEVQSQVDALFIGAFAMPMAPPGSAVWP
ncbi:hypothetical protein IV102_21105, partial [bacterium]|nr:hypothetical protein [bacterium]